MSEWILNYFRKFNLVFIIPSYLSIRCLVLTSLIKPTHAVPGSFIRRRLILRSDQWLRNWINSTESVFRAENENEKPQSDIVNDWDGIEGRGEKKTLSSISEHNRKFSQFSSIVKVFLWWKISHRKSSEKFQPSVWLIFSNMYWNSLNWNLFGEFSLQFHEFSFFPPFFLYFS